MENKPKADRSDNDKNNAAAAAGASSSSPYGGVFVDTSKSDRATWLMKCPPLVSKSLGSPREAVPLDHPMNVTDGGFSSSSSYVSPSPIVAKVVLSIDPLLSGDQQESPQFMMELASTESGDVPKRYSMEMSKDFVPMAVFSESTEGKMAVEGKILNKFDMRPHEEQIEKYGKLCRERTNKAMNRTRQIQVIDNDKCGTTFIRPLPPKEIKKKPVPKPAELKRTRRDRGEMEEIMFKLFERQPNWTLRNLIAETDQPEQFLKDLLKDLCVYNNKGANQGTYELKPEYKRSSHEFSTSQP
ncbi:hypothetical protein MLD38_024202 [Melastoma candidum]|uniref:Uncharacterized protein n=1 Tax=Melastoma candidum TaxID=119954 RepID=A0ACB9NSK0_9MYRT|nr:hypothetical protein MLD38_024202 [Melastoma candidum]